MQSPKSYYDPDYMIELAEKRVEQYTAAYHLIMGRLTGIIIIYSVLGIYLIPIILEIPEISAWTFRFGSGCLLLTTSISLYYTVLFMAPLNLFYPRIGPYYYKELRSAYEQRFFSSARNPDYLAEFKNKVDNYLKGTYIDELDSIQTSIKNFVHRKSRFYNLSMRWALSSILPYILCISFHLSKKTAPLKNVNSTYINYSLNCNLKIKQHD